MIWKKKEKTDLSGKKPETINLDGRKNINFFNKIKDLHNILSKKTAGMIHEVEKEPIMIFPKFSLTGGKPIIEFPNIQEQEKVNITYPLIEPFAYANLKWNSDTKEIEYKVVEPELSEEDRKNLKIVSNALVETVDVGISSIKNKNEIIPYLEGLMSGVVRDTGVKMTDSQYIKIMYYIYKDFVGLNEIEPLMQDPNIEDISCDGTDTPIFIIHRKFGSIKTNVSFPNAEELREFIIKMSEKAGRYVSYAEPILDGTLKDGSRVAATLASDVSTRGPTFTIRKFNEKPFSPIEQIKMKTIDIDLMTYLWYIIEHGISMLVVGGVATGKTSMLNTISMFIPPEAKVVSIEDTREIRIPHEHWVAGLARSGFGIPSASGKKYGEVTLFDLLKESFRQNPDYVIIGEVRGEETYVMFQGMSSGHPSLSTFHAGSVDSVIKRLTAPPINLSPSMIESLDVIAVMIHAREKGKSARRMKELSEIASIDQKTQEIKTNVVFRWDPVNDQYIKVNDSIKIERIAIAMGATLEEANKDIEDRKKVLEWLIRKDEKDFMEIAKYIHMYNREKDELFKIIGESASFVPEENKNALKTSEPVPAISVGTNAPHEKMEKVRKRRSSIFGLLGSIKELREK